MKKVFAFVTALGLSATVFAQQAAYTPPKNDKVPPADPYVADALKASPRHGEWLDIKLADGKPMKSWVVYPSASGKRGVVLVVFEIFGMNDWVRGVADQVAKDGFIAIAPDLLSGMAPNGGGSEELGTAGVRTAIGTLTPDLRAARLNAAMAYGKTMPSSNGKTGIVGFCWGGGTSLLYAIAQPSLNAAVMYYGPPPTQPGSQTPDLSGVPAIKAPILAFYGGNDARVTASVEPLKAEMAKQSKSYEPHVYDGAAHGFMHQRSEADAKAAAESWPLLVAFFQKNLK
jgi:carboxymethylenebutenolidase